MCYDEIISRIFIKEDDNTIVMCQVNTNYRAHFIADSVKCITSMDVNPKSKWLFASDLFAGKIHLLGYKGITFQTII